MASAAAAGGGDGRVGFTTADAVRLLTLGDGFHDPLPDRQHVLLWLWFGSQLRNSRQLTRAALDTFNHTATAIAASSNVPDEVMTAVMQAHGHSLAAIGLDAPDAALVAVAANMNIVRRSRQWEMDQHNFLLLGEAVTAGLIRAIPADVSPRQRATIKARITDIVRRWNLSSKDARTIRELVGFQPVHDSLRRANEWGQGPLYVAIRHYNNDQLALVLRDYPDMADAIKVAVRAVLAARRRDGRVAPAPVPAPARPASPQPPVLPRISAADAAWALSEPAGARRSIADEVIEILDDPLSFESMDDALSAAAAVAAERFR